MSMHAASALQAMTTKQQQQQNENRHAYGQFTNGDASLAPYLANMDKGRWPANVIHDGSDEVVGAFPQTQSGSWNGQKTGRGSKHSGNWGKKDIDFHWKGDAGSAARFFYSAKADANDRLNSKHPTVKPVDLMRWLVRLVTPKGGLVLDPFAGTGTTGAAAFYEGFRAVLIEREAEYVADITRRMDLLLAGPDEKARTLTTPETVDALPLFGGAA
jgi:site-specific DNA-methyltransferase (adenine-specific)